MNKTITFKNFEIPFSSNEEEIRQIIYKIISDNPAAPLDLFKQIYDIRPQKTYYPMALFKGQYQGSWTCETYHKEERVVVRESSDNIRYLDNEIHRIADNAGNTLWGDFATIMLAISENNPLADLLSNFTKDVKPDIFFTSNKKNIDNPVSSDDVHYIEKRPDLEDYWHINGKRLINKDVLRDAKEQLAGRNYSGLRVSFRHELSNPVNILHVPIWVFKYSYGGSQYQIIVDDASHTELSSVPIDKSISEIRNCKTEIEKDNIGCGCVVCLFFAMVAGIATVICDKESTERIAAIIMGVILVIIAYWSQHKTISKNSAKAKLLRQHIININFVRSYNGKIWLNHQGVETMNICTIPSPTDIISRALSTEIYDICQAAPPPLPKKLSDKQILSETQSREPLEIPQIAKTGNKKRSTFILLGIFFGLLGVHNFYAGYTARAVTQLVLTLLLCFFTAPFVFLWNIIECCVVKKDAKGIPFQ